jgi:hypothetical protein
MSIKEQIRAWFVAHPDVITDNGTLCQTLGIEDAQQVSVALNALANEVGIKREKKETGGRGLDYWMPLAVAEEIKAENKPAARPAATMLDAKAVTARLVKERKPRKDKGKKREPKPFKAAKRSKRAAPVPRVSKRAKKLIKKARRLAAPIETPAVAVSIAHLRDCNCNTIPHRKDCAIHHNGTAGPTPPQPLPTPAPDPRPASAAVFGIRDDGALGIDTGDSNVQISRADIARLRTFIEASKPLWI